MIVMGLRSMFEEVGHLHPASLSEVPADMLAQAKGTGSNGCGPTAQALVQRWGCVPGCEDLITEDTLLLLAFK
jgi:hypothetical protein